MRQWLILFILFAGLLVSLAVSGTSEARQTRRYTYQQLTVSTAAVALTPATYLGMGPCVLSLDPTNGLRYRQDGTAPTASVGVPIDGGDSITVGRGLDLEPMQFIRSGASDAILNVACQSAD